MSASLEFHGIGRQFPGAGGRPHVALADLSLDVPSGGFTAVVGPSGCGKTTLLNIASGLDTQYTGTFAIKPKDGVEACVFQSPRLLPWLNSRDNVAFVLESRGMARVAARHRSEEVLALVGLADVGGRFPGQLSGGMQQRVALARALAVDPALLLMDEPFASLDELTARRLRQELAQIHARRPMTVLFVTHHLQEACFLADRVVVMSGRPGQIVAQVEVRLPRPRTPDDPRLAEIAGELLTHIEAHHAGAQPVLAGGSRSR